MIPQVIQAGQNQALDCYVEAFQPERLQDTNSMRITEFRGCMCQKNGFTRTSYLYQVRTQAININLLMIMDGSANPSPDEVLKYILPLGMLFALALYCSNRAYLYSSVAFLQFCRWESHRLSTCGALCKPLVVWLSRNIAR